ncbi:hypothetical protein K439DRAFT_1616438 [Ramaria rubella]|nr:hypothetical protein K439DRAFT_1616438 [Ramaria rubella]
MRSSKKKAKVPRRSRDTPDPNLIVDGLRKHKPSACAGASINELIEHGSTPPPAVSLLEEVWEGGSVYETDMSGPGMDSLGQKFPPANVASTHIDFDHDHILHEVSPPRKASTACNKALTSKKAVDTEKEAQTRELLKYIRLCVPFRTAASQDAITIIKVSINETEADVRQVIYIAISCKTLSTNLLPELACKLSKDVKAHKFFLNDHGWMHLKEEWPLEVKKKGATSVVDIMLGSDFLKDLEMLKKIKKAKDAASSKNGKQSGGRAMLLKLRFESDDEDECGSDVQADYIPYDPLCGKILDDIKAYLLTCSQCSKKEKLCLMDKYGKHRLVSSEMLNTWVSALCADTPNVTVKCPPQSLAFADFHHSIDGGPTAVATTRNGRHEVVPLPEAQAPMPTQQIVYLPAPPPTSYHRKHHRDSSSSLPDHNYHARNRHSSSPNHAEAENEPSFPSVDLWLSTLEMKPGAEKCDFHSICAKFDMQSFLNMDIDDLAAVPQNEYGANGFKFNMAEVNFLFKWLDESMGKLRPKSRGRQGKCIRQN